MQLQTKFASIATLFEYVQSQTQNMKSLAHLCFCNLSTRDILRAKNLIKNGSLIGKCDSVQLQLPNLLYFELDIFDYDFYHWQLPNGAGEVKVLLDNSTIVERYIVSCLCDKRFMYQKYQAKHKKTSEWQILYEIKESCGVCKL